MDKKIFSWALYDFANTIFSMNIVSRYFPVLAITVLGGNDLAVGISRSSAMVLVALTVPVLGVIADRGRRRKFFLILFTLLCCILTALLSNTDNLIIELILFGLAIYCYQSALIFYNALLTSVAKSGKLGFVSGFGVSLGYVGSVSGLFIVAILAGQALNVYLWTAILFFVFSLPAFIWVKDVKIEKRQKESEQAVYRRGLISSFKRAAKVPGMIRFLVGRFFIAEAMETVILFMAVYLVKAAGFKDNSASGGGMDEVTLYLIIVTIFTVIGSYVWGVMTNKFGPKTMLLWAIVLWFIALAGFILTDNRLLYFLWGGLAGVGLGGVWTSDRPLLINLNRDDSRLAEFFGLYALSGRFAAVVGPLIWGAIIYFAEPMGVISYKIAIGSLLIMMLVGWIILRKVPDARIVS